MTLYQKSGIHPVIKNGNNMIDLDNLEEIKKLDESNVYDSINELPKQCLHAWEDTRNINVPDSYRAVNKVVMTGMGGSGLGARVIESVYASRLKYPLVRVNDYDLPDWVDDKTLVICSSFSGTTEETVENARQAQNRKAKWMAIGTGGELIRFAKECGVPFYQINPTHNPSKQPRLAIGYSIIGQLALATKAGIINLTKQDVLAAMEAMDKVRKEVEISLPLDKNPAKKLAQALYGKKVVFISARHLLAAAHTVKNQMNENAKNFSVIFDIPELNHFLMEGLGHPASNPKDLLFLFVNSNLYPQRIRERVLITQDVVAKNKVPIETWNAKAKDLLTQAFEFIQFGGFFNFYLAVLNELDPAPTPWVDYFKIKLGQPLGQWKK